MQLRKICNHPFMFGDVEEKISQHFNYTNGMCTGYVLEFDDFCIVSNPILYRRIVEQSFLYCFKFCLRNFLIKESVDEDKTVRVFYID